MQTSPLGIPPPPVAQAPKPPAPAPAPKPATTSAAATATATPQATPAGAQTMAATSAPAGTTANPAPSPGPTQMQMPQGNSIQSYINPYIDANLAPTIRNINETAQLQRSQLGSTAAMAGAFGDARHGVTEAKMMEGQQQQIADATGQAYASAWDRAMGMQSDDLNRQLQVAMQNAQFADTDLGRQFQSREAAADREAQRLLQSLGFDFQAGENAADRTFASGERQASQQFASQESAAQRALQQAMQSAGFQFQADQSAADRTFQGQQAADQRAWQSGESAADRTFRAGESAADRSLSWESLMKNLEDRGLDRQLQASQYGVQNDLARSQQEMDLSRLNMELDNYERGWEQTGLNTAYQDFMAQQMWPITIMQQIAGIANGTGSPTTTTTTTSQPNNAWSNVLGAALGSFF